MPSLELQGVRALGLVFPQGCSGSGYHRGCAVGFAVHREGSTQRTKGFAMTVLRFREAAKDKAVVERKKP